jgi:hypothetical protein
VKESELCAIFRDAAEADGWIVHPEVAGWDLVLVWSGDAPVPEGATPVRKGDQVAVEAKLRANVQALNQAATRSTRSRGTRPDFRAVLAPKVGADFQNVAGLLGVGVFSLRHCGPWSYRRSYERERKIVAAPRWRRNGGSRLWVPPIVSDHPAGEASPRTLTPWRVKALRLIAKIRERGHATTADFKAARISPTIWRQQKWLVPAGRVGRLTRYVLNEDHPGLPDRGWEIQRDAIVAQDLQ